MQIDRPIKLKQSMKAVLFTQIPNIPSGVMGIAMKREYLFCSFILRPIPH